MDEEDPYLLVGVRGKFQPLGSASEDVADSIILSLYERWGLRRLPWETCTSGVSFQDDDSEAVRGWLHVDLRADDSESGDVPIRILLQQLWDGLQLFGNVLLSGIDVIFPASRAGNELRRRVFMVPMVYTTESPTPVDVFASPLLSIATTSPWALGDAASIARRFLDVEPTEIVQCAVSALERRDNPFPDIIHSPGRRIRAPHVTLEYLAWIAEVFALAFGEMGVRDTVHLRIRSGFS